MLYAISLNNPQNIMKTLLLLPQDLALAQVQCYLNVYEKKDFFLSIPHFKRHKQFLFQPILPSQKIVSSYSSVC